MRRKEGGEAGPGVFSSRAVKGWWVGRPGGGPGAVQWQLGNTWPGPKAPESERYPFKKQSPTLSL